MQQITFNEFAQLVREMRHAQVEYFRFKTKSHLITSMRLEAAIDKILKNIEPAKKEEVSKYYQQNLFK